MAPGTTVDVNQLTAADMKAARSQTSISVQTVRNYLYGEQKVWDLRERLEKILVQEPLFDKQHRDFLGRTDQYIRSAAIINRLDELRRIHSWSEEEYTTATSLLSEVLSTALHDAAFQPVFLGQGSSSLMENYWDLVYEKGIQGCYLQTELGHGTNVARLETTSTYIPETQEFEINSPSLTSTKWWIGALGKSATHGAVQAKLILPDGKDMGPHLFFVQLRSLEDHKPLPGITVGDIGPKAGGGLAAQDQGFARFDHVRIPRTNMFSKFAEVTTEGSYIQPPHAKLSYGGMMYIRANMIPQAGWNIAKAVTVAIRYTTVRRQGEPDAKGLERQVLTYPSTYYRLLPILSRAFVFIELGRYTIKALNEMQQRLANRDMSLLPEMHALLCGLKVLVTTHGISDIETARRSMGGHGYSAFAGLGRLYVDYLPSATFEGDNFVLDGQVVRAATKLCKSVLSSTSAVAKLPLPSAYLRLLSATSEAPPQVTASTWHHIPSVVLLLEWRAALMVKNFTQTQASGDVDASVNQRLAKAVTEAFVAAQVGEMIKNLTMLPSEDAKVVGCLYRLYLLTSAESALVDLLSVGLIRHTGAGDPTQDLRLAVKALCLEVLPNAIGLSDAFGFSDWSLDSALGVFDGRVYEALWKRVQMEPMNKDEVTPAYAPYLRPMRQRGQAAAEQKRKLKSRL
ncbi:acyl-CoA dehydrogenase/oxidase C-terminal [Suillus clintonianus]|uniref:acyl-CoA dehydrogenase/oxidase C-terminal n=1 Tax=Suillus clintonianus TaxID=1904413 RepID=UPI001B86E065|nr:acyl-CoA dehydrogenase/oxidase C-terminal [Suillus clintonianus]KAG2119395.1 acyl-CoA dehydrogenase/oxidase C-terminal [Suillus clintonianus]